jgi:hypothetical protein
MAITIPLAVSQQATDYIAEHDLEAVFQRMLDHIPQHFSGLQSISVILQPPYDLGGNDCVIIDVKREIPTQNYDPSDRNWRSWLIDNFLPDEFTHFCLLSNNGGADEG